jgi:hypothetical protein
MILASEDESFDVVKVRFQSGEWEVREQEVKANLSDGSQIRKRQGRTHLSNDSFDFPIVPAFRFAFNLRESRKSESPRR